MSPRETWLCDLVGHWQAVVGFRTAPRDADLEGALELVRQCASMPTDPLERLLLRGFILEVGLLIDRLAETARADERDVLRQLAHQLCDVGPMPVELRATVTSLLQRLHDAPLPGDAELAARARACIDERPTRYPTVSTLARELGTNSSSLERSFRRAFHITVGHYLREARASAAFAALRQATAVKGVAFSIGCSEATLRRLVRRQTGASPKMLVRARTGRTNSSSRPVGSFPRL